MPDYPKMSARINQIESVPRRVRAVLDRETTNGT